jgi:predicted MFS family arabinose efflux permease
MLGVYTILQVTEQGWLASSTLGLGAVSVALIAAFLARQARIANPLMPLRLFRSRNVAGANLVQGLVVVGMFGMFFLGALYLQRVLGYDPLQVGLAFLPSTLVMGVLSMGFSGRITMRFGAKKTLIPSLLFIGAGMLLFARTPIDGSYVADVMPAMILVGIGAGLSFPALMTLAMSGATPQDSGLASGLVNTSAQVGGAVGLAVLATLATERTQGLVADGEAAMTALNAGFHLAYVVGALVLATAVVIAATVLRPEGAAQPAPSAPEHERDGARREPAYSMA